MKTSFIIMTLLLAGCIPASTRFSHRSGRPYSASAGEIYETCVDGVTYLTTQSGLDGITLTLKVDLNGKPVRCEEEEGD